MKKGFTLIEMLTVVLIVAALTAVAVPQYRRSVERARMSEAVQMLPAIYDAVDRYYAARPVTEEDILAEGAMEPGTSTGGTAAGGVNLGDIKVGDKEAITKDSVAAAVMVAEAAKAETAKAETAVMPKTGAVMGKVGGFSETAGPISEEASLGDVFKEIAEDKNVTFAKLDLNLKGRAGEGGNVWITPNFTYEITKLPGVDDVMTPYFVQATVARGKYEGTIFGYTGTEVLCAEPQKGGAKGACALMGMKDVNEQISDGDLLDLSDKMHTIDSEKIISTGFKVAR